MALTGSIANAYRESPAGARAWRGVGGRHNVIPSTNTFPRLPFNTGPSLWLTVMLVGGMMPIFRHMIKVPKAGPLSRGSFGHVGIIEIGIC